MDLSAMYQHAWWTSTPGGDCDGIGGGAATSSSSVIIACDLDVTNIRYELNPELDGMLLVAESTVSLVVNPEVASNCDDTADNGCGP